MCIRVRCVRCVGWKRGSGVAWRRAASCYYLSSVTCVSQGHVKVMSRPVDMTAGCES